MKTSDTNNAMPRLQTINECPQEAAPICPAHSNGKPDVPVPITSISVRFAPDLAHQFQMDPVKRTSPASQAPFRDLMQHPEKLEVAIKTARILLSTPRARSAGTPAKARRQTQGATRAKTRQHQD
jgi:hypothetical protein